MSKVIKRTKDIPVGSIINYDGILLKVVEAPYNNAICKGCFFSDWEREKKGLAKFSCYIHKMACTKYLRKDNKHVIFVENYELYNNKTE